MRSSLTWNERSGHLGIIFGRRLRTKSKNVIHKALAFRGKQSGTGTVHGTEGSRDPAPPALALRWGFGSAARVRPDRRRISMTKTTKKRSARSKEPSAQRQSHPGRKNDCGSEATGRRGTKQARAIEMLRSKHGVSIPALMEATGWQQHSIRGFLAGVVRKRLKLNLVSALDASVRMYRITGESRSPGDRSPICYATDSMSVKSCLRARSFPESSLRSWIGISSRPCRPSCRSRSPITSGHG